jgi:zona occludens toxin (predicted ATPase)
MKNYYVIDALQQDVEYVITETETDNGTLHQLWRSMGSTWSEDVKGELLVSLENDGNGFKYKFKPREKKRIDYDEIEWLYLLIDFVRKQDNSRSIYNICQYA